MKYTISYTYPNTHFIDIILFLDDLNEEEITLHLPSWRPGRYEMANFAKNIQKFKVLNENGDELFFKKISKSSWKIKTLAEQRIYVHYNYYAYQMDAGNSFLDESQLYINFINCMLYEKSRMQSKCQVELKIPEDYNVACGLPQNEKNILEAVDYYRLVDSPMIASRDLNHFSYKINDFNFHVWIMGSVNTQWEKVRDDFYHFSKYQIEMMKDFPHPDYHFLFQILPYKHYHGVEHFNSTVITIGPSEKFNRKEFYNNLLGVSSHELFHTWNVIRIRPVEMMPYDFSRETYFYTGFVAEGFTTYYGDLVLARSGVYDKHTYLKELNTIIRRHFENNGRKNLSLTDSSFDLWLDGYANEVPNRKVSIYIKGAVVALMIDLEIRAATKNSHSLDDLMRFLWKEYGKKEIGYELEDIRRALEELTQINFGEFFLKFIQGTEAEENRLAELLKFVGCQLKPSEEIAYEANFGFKILALDASVKINAIQPGSIAEPVLSLEDEIIALDDRKIENNFADLISNKKEVNLSIFRNKTLKKIKLTNTGEKYWGNFEIIQDPSATEIEMDNFENWLGCDW